MAAISDITVTVLSSLLFDPLHSYWVQLGNKSALQFS